MTNQSIYLLGKNGNYGKLDIEDLSLSYTDFNIADINDITRRKDKITKDITIKATKNNNKILGNCFNLNVFNNQNINEDLFYNYNINGEVEALFYENDSLLSKGLFKITESNVKDGVITYSASITGYINNFFVKLSDKLLSDLDFTEYNHRYTLENIFNSWSTSIQKSGTSTPFQLGKGYVYGTSDYGTSIYPDKATVENASFKDYRPSFYLIEYLNKIFAQTDYTYSISGSTQFQSMFNSLVVPNNSEYLVNYLNSEKLLVAAKTNSQRYRTGRNQYIYESVNNAQNLQVSPNWNNISFINSFLEPNTSAYLNYTKNVFHVLRSISTSIEASVGIDFETYFPRNGHAEDKLDATVTLHVLTRTTDVYGWDKVLSSEPQRVETNGANFRASKVFKVKGNLNLVGGGQLMLAFEFTDYYKDWGGLIPLADEYLEAIITPANSGLKIGDTSFNSVAQLEQGDLIDFKNNFSLSTYKQQDFVKSILNLFNLYVYATTENPKHLIFESYNDFYNECLTTTIKGNALNWSKKIDYSDYTKKAFSTIYKSYKFNYKEDSDYLNADYRSKYGSVYGNYIYSNSSTKSTTENSLELTFAGTPVANFEGNDRTQPLFFKYESNGNKKPYQSVLRLMVYNGVKDCKSYNIGKWYQDFADNATWKFTSYDSNRLNYAQFHTTHLNSSVDLSFIQPDEVFYKYENEPKYAFIAFYNNQITEYNDSNTVTFEAKALLNEIDISNLDFKKPYYIDSPSGDGYFKLVSLNYNNNTELSDAVFQKIYLADTYKTEIFYSAAISGYTSNSICTTSENIFVNVAAGKYSSKISQLDADAQAQAEYNHMLSGYQNSGACINTSVQFSLAYSDTNTDACAAVTDSVEYYTSTGTLEIGSIIFKKINGIYSRASFGYYSTGGNWYLANETATINVTGSCSNVGLNEAILATNSSKTSSCNNAGIGFNLGTYYYTTYITVGQKIFTNSAGTTPVGAGFYSDAYYSYQTDSSGTIINSFYC
ncbi:DUF5977 domain-containing protein [Pedobacter aquatilis]|uniref:DUF5977 domain-containing protein n=1 Tax=Pedobacter aquatilis TaxID=351343 RepID=UPI00292DED5F|nr:hypothetical protein [Pedobacter aquatilis]